MIAYNYDPETGELTGTETVQESPLEPGVFLLPANAVFSEPPEAREGFARVWNGSWEYAEDHRGATIWKDHETSRTVDHPGPIPEGWSLTRPEKKLTREALMELIYTEKCRVAYGGIQIEKDGERYFFATDQNSIAMCNAMLLSLNGKPSDTVFSWKVYRNQLPELLALTKTEFETVFTRGMEMIHAAFWLEGALYERLETLDETQYDSFRTEISSSFGTLVKTFTIGKEEA